VSTLERVHSCRVVLHTSILGVSRSSYLTLRHLSGQPDNKVLHTLLLSFASIFPAYLSLARFLGYSFCRSSPSVAPVPCWTASRMSLPISRHNCSTFWASRSAPS
jgi:hypothetical protein